MALVATAACQWRIFLLAAVAILVRDEVLFGNQRESVSHQLTGVWQRYAPLLLIGIALFPVLLYEFEKLSHHFVGPVLQLNRELRRLGNGEDVFQPCFRDHDYWHDLAESFNCVRSKVQEQKIVRSKK